MDKLKQFIKTLHLTPNLKLFGVGYGKAGHGFGSVEVKSVPEWTQDTEIPSSRAVKTLVTENLTSKVDKVTGKELSDNNLTNAILALIGATKIVNTPNLLPTKSTTSIPYGTDQQFVITANTPTIEGNDIIIEFVNPYDISQTLAVSYDDETKTVTISHSTSAGVAKVITDIDGDGTIATATSALHGLTTGDKIKITGTTSYNGSYDIIVVDPNTFTFPHAAVTTNESGTGTTIVINTSSAALKTALNTDVATSLIVTANAGSSGTVTREGSVSLGGYVLGRVCKEGELFATDTTLYIALVATNGITNANNNFKKITLSNI